MAKGGTMPQVQAAVLKGMQVRRRSLDLLPQLQEPQAHVKIGSEEASQAKGIQLLPVQWRKVSKYSNQCLR